MIKKENIFKMRVNGMTFQAIADELGCSKQYANCEYNKKKGKEGRFVRVKTYNAYGKMAKKIVYPKINKLFFRKQNFSYGFL